MFTTTEEIHIAAHGSNEGSAKAIAANGGVGELERQGTVAAPVVQRGVGMRVVVRLDVPDDQPAVPVDGEVDLVERAVDDLNDQPADDHGGEGDRAGPD
jgi:hypothetical protein